MRAHHWFLILVRTCARGRSLDRKVLCDTPLLLLLLVQGVRHPEEKTELFNEIQKVIDAKQLKPMVRTQYMRTLFQVSIRFQSRYSRSK